MKSLHPSLGPHEGIELKLMLENKKDIALFYSDYEVPSEFNTYIKNGRFLLKKITIEASIAESSIDFFIIYQNKSSENVSKLIACIKETLQSKALNLDAERHIGRLLGYSEHDIEFYIQHCLNTKNINNPNLSK